jgi:molybdate transport system regulatory protein
MNRVQAKIKEITISGGVMLVDMEAEGCLMSALLINSTETITWLKKEALVTAIFKETEVSIAKNFSGEISLRNRLDCIVDHISKGELLSTITLKFNDTFITSAITTRSVNSLDLHAGENVTAMIKANEITLIQNV